MENSQILKYLAITFCFLLFFICLSKISDVKEKNRQFEGIIESIEYSEKKIPVVTIKGTRYGLTTGWSFNEKMEAGDYLIKKEKTMVYKLIKLKTGEVILSDKDERN
jgi:hypothetical protein